MKVRLILFFLVLGILGLGGCLDTNKIDEKHFYGISLSTYNPLQKYKDYPMYRLTSSYRYYPVAFDGNGNIIFFDKVSSFTNLHISNTNIDLGDSQDLVSPNLNTEKINQYKTRLEFVPTPTNNTIFFASSDINDPMIIRIGYHNLANNTTVFLTNISLLTFKEHKDLSPEFLSLSPNGKYYVIRSGGYSNIQVGDIMVTGAFYVRIRILDLENNSLIKEYFSPIDNYLPVIDDRVLFSGVNFSENDSKVCFYKSDSLRVYPTSNLDSILKSYDGKFDRVIWNYPYLLCIEMNPIRISEYQIFSGSGVIIINLENDDRVVVGNKSYETHGPFFDGKILYEPIVYESHAILSPDRKKLILKIDPEIIYYPQSEPVLLEEGVYPSDIIGTWVIDISSLGL